jgi:hypothetical protein
VFIVTSIVLNVRKELNPNTSRRLTPNTNAYQYQLTPNTNAYQYHVNLQSRRMRRAGHVSGIGERRGVYRVLGDPSIDGRIILRCIFRKWEWGDGLDRAGAG